MTQYQINHDRLDDYLRFNINNPIIRDRLFQNNNNDWMNYGGAIQQINPWILYLNFNIYPGRIYHGWKNNNDQSLYDDEEIEQIINYININNLRLPGEPGYHYTYNNPVMSNKQRRLIINKIARNFNFGKKNNNNLKNDIRRLKNDLRRLKKLKN